MEQFIGGGAACQIQLSTLAGLPSRVSENRKQSERRVVEQLHLNGKRGWRSPSEPCQAAYIFATRGTAVSISLAASATRRRQHDRLVSLRQCVQRCVVLLRDGRRRLCPGMRIRSPPQKCKISVVRDKALDHMAIRNPKPEKGQTHEYKMHRDVLLKED